MRDQEIRGRLVHALREAGIVKNPRGLADAICAAINCKITNSEGRHHSKFHKVTPPSEPASRESQKDGASLHSGGDVPIRVTEADGSKWVDAESYDEIQLEVTGLRVDAAWWRWFISDGDRCVDLVADAYHGWDTDESWELALKREIDYRVVSGAKTTPAKDEVLEAVRAGRVTYPPEVLPTGRWTAADATALCDRGENSCNHADPSYCCGGGCDGDCTCQICHKPPNSDLADVERAYLRVEIDRLRKALDSMEARCASGSTADCHNPDIREDTVRQARDTPCDASSLAKLGEKP